MKLIFHCSQSTFGNAATLTIWHLQRGWRTCGYHFVILNGCVSENSYNLYLNGHIETGRPLDNDNILEVFEYGAHVYGQNKQSIGVCLIGKSGIFTDSQLYAARNLFLMLQEQFFELSVYQHSDFDSAKDFCAGLSEKSINFIKQG